ncbi:MAG TPA: winged helix-turn-helix domain-containing protein [Acidobacteriaceae bacterium]|nr:winged helix-turn-helix domain-containing protein [Acidobacteriaceae bacterium]
MGNSIQRSIARFEDFEVNLETGEVWKAGRPLKVQDQPFKVLAALLERPGQIVTREELRQLIWPDKSFGDFDHAINLALAKLRATLGDSADVPHLIETLPRRGYRFIAPLKEQSDPPPAPAIATPQQQAVPSPVKEYPAKAGGKKLWTIAGASAFLFLFAVMLFRVFPTLSRQPEVASEIMPLVAMPGLQTAPAVSPDGSQVAFEYSGAPHPGIYLALIGGERPLQLTEGENDHDPAWSPDGRQIAFARYPAFSGGPKNLYVLPALGGAERRVYTAALPAWFPCNKIGWSPDGKSLVFSESVDDGTKARLTLLSLSDMAAHALTFPSIKELDCDPVFSPDGATVAFARGPMASSVSDLFVVKVAGGQILRLTTGNSGGDAGWTQDGSEIVFASCMKGVPGLWRIPASGGMPQRVAGVGEYAGNPSISRRGNQLAYTIGKQWETIWRLDLKDRRHALAAPVRLLSGRGIAWRPSYSPDGKKIVFESNRMGYADIWMCNNDGSNCSQLTALHGTTGTARWSPDGRYVSFESISQDYYQVGVVEVPDGTPRILKTVPVANNGAPNWSHDGRSIYFYSDDHGSFQLWKMPLKGGPPVQETTSGGVYGIESKDARFLYYSEFDGAIWKKSLDSGQTSRLPIDAGSWYDWDVTDGGIYFLNLKFPPNGRIEFFDFANGQSTPIFALDKPASLYGGLALSPDGKSILFGQSELNESYIMVMKNFR